MRAARSSSKAWVRATANFGRLYGDTNWIFEGPEIFKRAVIGMAGACADVLAAQGYKADDIDLVVPHQANLRIIEAVAKRAGVPMERVFVNVHRYGNMSAATVPVALVEALEEGRVKPGSLLLLPAFGAGLTWCAHLVRWGERVTPQGHHGRGIAALRQDGARDRAGFLRKQKRPELRRRAPLPVPPQTPMTPVRKALLQIHFCVVLWGFTAILGKLISLPALELVWWRMLLVVVVLASSRRSGAGCGARACARWACSPASASSSHCIG